MNYRWIEDIGEFREIAAEWDEALIFSGNYNPFLLSDFIVTWWKYFHDNPALRIFILYNDERIIGGIPLYLRRGKGREGFAKILCCIGGSVANYTEPLYAASKSEILPFFIEALSKRNDWDVLHLPNVRAENRLLAEHRTYLSDRRFFLYVMQDHMDWAINLSGGAEKYFAAISKKLMRDLRAKRRRVIKDLGELKLKEIKGKGEIERYFNLYVKFSLQAFQSRTRKSTFEDKQYTAFFREFLVLMDNKQRLDAHVLLGGDKILAVSFGYRFGKGFNWVLTAFNYKYKYFRPGYLLIEELIKEVCNRGETYYNWYGYERFYKTQWCNTQTPLYSLFLIRRTLKGVCYKMIQDIERTLRSNKTITGFIRKLRRN